MIARLLKQTVHEHSTLFSSYCVI